MHVTAAIMGWVVLASAAAFAGERPVKSNRLAGARSPYLRQHQSNPVDWYPWGDEAFRRARETDRPVFLSIGYAACHWCHVMERESFEDDETARILNRVFVCVKVDREERPDVDRAYMIAAQLFGRGGWPMTVLLTPAGEPFWGGTYLPQRAVQRLAADVERAWTTNRDGLLKQAAAVGERARAYSRAGDLPSGDMGDPELLRRLRTSLASRFDSRHGGYGERPKFPPHAELLFLLERGGARTDGAGLAQAKATLEALLAGGIHDHVGGGFHRYSTDERWLLPHFEKMLYDNALLAMALSEAETTLGGPLWRPAVERLFGWLEREMKRPGGGYASSLDADTRGEEGATYTWTLAEVQAALAPDAAALLVEISDLRPEGNVRDEATGKPLGRNVIHLAHSPAQIAARRGWTEGDVRGLLLRALDALHEVRARRHQPPLDGKVITAWNGLLVSAYARAGTHFRRPDWSERARELARFLLGHSRGPDGTLLRFPRASGPPIPGFCEDHVHLIEGLLDLHEATAEPHWLSAARDLAERLLAFEDGEGGFFSAAESRHEMLFTRTKEIFDSPIPSDNATAARLFLRLHAQTHEAKYRDVARRTLGAWRGVMGQALSGGVVGLFRALADLLDLREASIGGYPQPDVRATDGPVTAALWVEREEAALSSGVKVRVRVTLEAGWHLQPAGVEETTTRLYLGDPAPAALGEVRYPPAVPIRTVAGAVQGLEGPVWIDASLRVPGGGPLGPRRIPLRLGVQACDATGTCRAPVVLPLDFPLRFAEADGPRRHDRVFDAGSARPSGEPK